MTLGARPTGDVALITFDGQAANEACVDATANPTPEGRAGSVTLVLRYGNLDQNVFVQVQDAVGPDPPFGPEGAFDRAFFYRGLNGRTPWPGGITFTDVTPFATGRIHVAVSSTNGHAGHPQQQTATTSSIRPSPRQVCPQPGLGVGIGLAVGVVADIGADAIRELQPENAVKQGHLAAPSKFSVPANFLARACW